MRATYNDLIRTLINLDDLTAAHVALSSGLTPSTVSRYLNSKTDIKSENLFKILKFLGIDLHQILKREILNRLNNRHHASQSDDDLLLAINSLNEIDQKILLNTIVAALPANTDKDTRAAGTRLAKKAQILAIRKRRHP